MSLSLSDVILGTSTACGLLIAKAWNWISQHYVLRKRLSCRLKNFCHFFLSQLRAYGLEPPLVGTNRSPDVGGESGPAWVLGVSWSWGWGCRGFTPTQSLQMVWIRLTGVICFLASGFTALTDPRTQIWLFKAVFQGNEACSCHSLPACSRCVRAGATVVQRGKCSHSTVCCPGGKMRWALAFCSSAYLVFGTSVWGKEFSVLLDSAYSYVFMLWKQYWKLMVWQSYPFLIAYKKEKKDIAEKKTVYSCAWALTEMWSW